MKATTKANLNALFGTSDTVNNRALGTGCKIKGRLARTINGRLCVSAQCWTDLWVWTAQPDRASQDVHCRIDLSQPDAIEQLGKQGVVLAEQTV